VVVDCAHNAYSMQRLGQALKDHFDYDRLIFVLGFGADKDIGGMIEEAVRLADDIFLVKSKHPRSVPVATLVERFREKGGQPRTAPGVNAALQQAMAEAGSKGLVCAAGSVFVVAEVMEELL
jgi:dihydrofolate synthase / folylpolyglutamate synthase